MLDCLEQFSYQSMLDRIWDLPTCGSNSVNASSCHFVLDLSLPSSTTASVGVSSFCLFYLYHERAVTFPFSELLFLQLK